MENRPKASGLKWKRRARGAVAYWKPTAEAIKAGYPSGYVPLEAFQADPEDLVHRCGMLQADMLNYLSGYRRDRLAFDGTIGSVLRLYQAHPDSPWHTLAGGTRKPYAHYLGRLEAHIGKRRVATVIALDVKDWFRVWSDGGRTVAGARMAVAALKAALKFACAAGYEDCRRLRTVLQQDITFPGLRPRTSVVTADGVNAARRAAHAAGRPSRALCYALQFETLLRQWDVRGQWLPLAAPVLSDVVDGDEKWAGLRWEHIGPDLVLRYRPSKTSKTTAAEIVADLAQCPMVMDELAHWPAERRTGPVIVNEATGRPYTNKTWEGCWNRDRASAGLPKGLWNRDLRASGITEARAGNASLDDLAKVAGHAKPKMTARVYDRAALEAHRRTAEARKSGRGE
jgi:hypothetical protein